ncbi:uncharacterized protein JCM6883_004636, partial [Sporobolomyces salmoneus]|uniref:uncharacterized protein n=1 Tax=Sporobolomyces salmoneus TaxID=183962 RepID=UPI00317C9042
MDDSLPIASTSTSPYEERAQSPSQETVHSHLHQDSLQPILGKRKLSESAPSSESPAPIPLSSTSLDPSSSTTLAASTSAPQYPSIAPLPLFAPPPSTLPPHPSFEFFSTRSHPFNKHGFRYTPCGPSPNSPLPVPPQRIIESL